MSLQYTSLFPFAENHLADPLKKKKIWKEHLKSDAVGIKYPF